MNEIYASYIKDLIKDYKDVQEWVFPNDPSAAQSIYAHLTKILVLTCASCYEQQIQDSYANYAQKEADKYSDKPHTFDNHKRDKNIYQRFVFERIETPNDKIQEFNLKRFLKPLNFFGDKFSQKIFDEFENNEEKKKQAEAFHEIFAMRNLLAHQTFVVLNSRTAIREKSFNDISDLHDKAVKFVDYLISQFT